MHSPFVTAAKWFCIARISSSKRSGSSFSAMSFKCALIYSGTVSDSSERAAGVAGA
jgi:hypothetical protein